VQLAWAPPQALEQLGAEQRYWTSLVSEPLQDEALPQDVQLVQQPLDVERQCWMLLASGLQQGAEQQALAQY